MNIKREHLSHLIYIILGAFLALIFNKASLSYYNTTGSYQGINFNLFIYVAALAAAFVLWLILFGFASLITKKTEGLKEIPALRRIAGLILYVIYGAAAAGILLLIYEIYINENNLYPGTASSTFLRQEINHRYYFLMIVLIAAILFFTLSRDIKKQNRSLRIGLAGLFALINAIATWCPNIFKDNGGGVPHIHAVLNSIVNVARFQPYSELNCSIYGHYSLIFLPFVKIFGDDLTAIMVTIVGFTFVSFLAAFYVTDKLVRSDSLFVFALAAITGTTTIFTRRGQYYQINPLRLLFPMLMLAVITFGVYEGSKTKKLRTLTRVLEYVIGLLSVVWNFETGLFCVAVCAAVRVFKNVYDEKLLSLNTLINILRAAAYAIISLAGAYGLVNIYNLLTGGGINSVKLFIYPLMSGTYDVNMLRVPLPSVEYLYFLQILLFFATALIVMEHQWRGCVRVISGAAGGSFFRELPEETALSETFSDTSGDSRIDTLRFAISLSGLSSLIYFMNRAAYSNMSIAHIQMILLLASWGQHALDLRKDNWKDMLKKPLTFFRSAVSVILFGGLVWLAIEGAMHIEVCYDFRANSSWQMENYVEGLEEINTTIPANTFGFGHCVPEVWYQLGWDTGCYMTDWSDINAYNKKYALEEAKKHDEFVTTLEGYEFEGYKLKKKIKIGKYEFKYYVKK